MEARRSGRERCQWVGAGAPEWGAAIAFPTENAIVMQGSRANSSAGDPSVTLRHELAHLALHEYLADIPPRWFDEGYAAFAAGGSVSGTLPKNRRSERRRVRPRITSATELSMTQ